MKIVLLHQYVVTTPCTFPIYLGGPVQGGNNWQVVFLRHFIDVSVMKWSDSFRKRMLQRIHFMVPCIWPKDHMLAEYFSDTCEVLDESYANETERSAAMWSVFQRNIAVTSGGLVIYGLFPENKDYPRVDGLPYACVTRAELAYSSVMMLGKGAPLYSLLIGKHKDFPGIRDTEDSFRVQMPPDWRKDNTCIFTTPEQFADWVTDRIEHVFLKNS